MPKKTTGYTNESIVALKGADRVRKRPSVIFGSDGLEGCQHSIFEIISNSIDEARDGYGNKIIITRYADGSVECEDFGRGLPVDFNSNDGGAGQSREQHSSQCITHSGAKTFFKRLDYKSSTSSVSAFLSNNLGLFNFYH